MSTDINMDVLSFVGRNPEFTPTKGVVTSISRRKVFLQWGAVGKNGQTYISYWDQIIEQMPDATWQPIEQQIAAVFDEAIA